MMEILSNPWVIGASLLVMGGVTSFLFNSIRDGVKSIITKIESLDSRTNAIHNDMFVMKAWVEEQKRMNDRLEAANIEQKRVNDNLDNKINGLFFNNRAATIEKQG